MRPSVGCSKPPIIRSVVVLPQPDGPSIAKNDPRGISSEMPSTATMSSNRLTTCSSRTSGAGASVAVTGASVPAGFEPCTAFASLLRELHDNVLDAGVLLHRVDRHVLAVAGLLEAAVRHLGGEREEVLVD